MRLLQGVPPPGGRSAVSQQRKDGAGESSVVASSLWSDARRLSPCRARTAGPVAAGGRGQSQLLRSQVLARLAQGGHRVGVPERDEELAETVTPTRAEPELPASQTGPRSGKAPVPRAPWARAGPGAGGTWRQADRAQDAAVLGALQPSHHLALRPRPRPSLPRSPAGEVRPRPPSPARVSVQERAAAWQPRGLLDSGLGDPAHGRVSPSSEAGGGRRVP